MLRFFFVACLVSVSTISIAARKPVHKPKRISAPEFWWAVKHCFIAGKAFCITKQSLAITAEVFKDSRLDGDHQGGQVDAFRHAFWMAMLSQKINPRKAQKLGIAHEKGNYIDFCKGRLEDGLAPDKISSAMDLYNNEKGVNIGFSNRRSSVDALRETVVRSILNGDLIIMYKDHSGNYLQCNDSLINLKEYEGKWAIPKCLVPSYHGKK